MALTILGGLLSPVVHDGSVQDLVYGVDGAGRYLGLTPAAGAAAAADCAPPRMGEYRWDGSAWQRFKSITERGGEIEAIRDATIAAGATWSNRVWYADPQARQQLADYIQAYSEGTIQLTDKCPVRAKDKVVYQLGRLELRLLSSAVRALVQQAYVDSWAAKALIGAD